MHNNNNDSVGNSIEDVWLRCQSCSMEFLHSVRDQEFFARMQLTEPRTCKPCRQARKALQQQY